MEIKEEFYNIMTAHTAEIFYEVLGLEIILSDGEVGKVEVSPDSEMDLPIV
ncbi:hypothetical protein [Qiania dongpingensis]|uniref:Uncharacterized protein n=1 Tax=Qiania dongpingensis TaxID=2763669 RepID=A0A7G9G5G6_9FIRM|nr:hypothetical protein [Qiania dongpingensis]QNM06048.1 hypothetical protein H9Q78_02475 [Qiania dongpingensis]